MSSTGFLLADIEDKVSFINSLRLDMTPEALFKPRFLSPDDPQKAQEAYGQTDGFMFYVDFLHGSAPTLMLMKTKHLRSSTVGEVEGVPAELLTAAVAREGVKDYCGMYPLDEALTNWLREQLQITD